MKTMIPGVLALLSAALPADATPPAHGWTAAERIGGIGWSDKSTAIDASGNAVAVWTEYDKCPVSGQCVVGRARPTGGVWGPTSILALPDSSNGNYLGVHMTDAGRATAIWSSNLDIYAADKPLNGAWSKVVRLPFIPTSGLSIFFSEDAVGHMAVVHDNYITIRGANGRWGKPMLYTPIDTNRLHPVDLQLSPNGDIIVGFYVFNNGCNRNHVCGYDNILHVARLRRGSSTWQDSGPLNVAAEIFQSASVAIDDNGRAGAVVSTSESTTPSDYSTTTSVQPVGGQRWSAPVNLAINAYVNGFGTDATGNATILLSERVNSTDRVVAFGGSLGVGAYTLQAVLSAPGSSTSLPLLAISPLGSANAIWISRDPSTKRKSIAAASRPSASAPWTAPTDLAPHAPIASTTSVAAAGNGQSIAIWSGYVDPDGPYYPNAAEYRP